MLNLYDVNFLLMDFNELIATFQKSYDAKIIISSHMRIKHRVIAPRKILQNSLWEHKNCFLVHWPETKIDAFMAYNEFASATSIAVLSYIPPSRKNAIWKKCCLT